MLKSGTRLLYGKNSVRKNIVMLPRAYTLTCLELEFLRATRNLFENLVICLFYLGLAGYGVKPLLLITVDSREASWHFGSSPSAWVQNGDFYSPTRPAHICRVLTATAWAGFPWIQGTPLFFWCWEWGLHFCFYTGNKERHKHTNTIFGHPPRVCLWPIYFMICLGRIEPKA